jgi:hypothetical protein
VTTRKTSGKKKGKTHTARTILDSIRKQIPPPGKTFGEAKPYDRSRPAKRKAKHKGRVQDAASDFGS